MTMATTATTQLELVTPEALLLCEGVGMVVIPGVEGDMGIMVDHAPTVSTLRPGVLSVHETASSPANRRIFVGGGVVEVTNAHCIILAEEAADLADLSKDQAEARLAEAQAALDTAASEGEKTQAKAELAIAQAQVAALL